MIYFRADSNSKIGMGHMMRCLSVAQKLKNMTDVSFLCADRDGADFVKSRGIAARYLYEEYIYQEPFSLSEADLIVNKVSAEDMIVVDSYLYSNDYIIKLQNKLMTVIFDDMPLNAFGADALINYNTYASKEEYIALYEGREMLPKFFLGGDYTPLRDEFMAVERNFEPRVEDILITTGGGDSQNIGGSIASALLGSLDKDINIHLICGSFNPNYESLAVMARDNENLTIHRAVNNMAQLMSRCQLAVSAGGSTCYELCASKVPFVVFSYADNQKRLAENMESNKVAQLAGHIWNEESQSQVLKNIAQKIIQLINEDSLRKEMFEKCGRLVDGKGSQRLAECLYKLYKEGQK